MPTTLNRQSLKVIVVDPAHTGNTLSAPKLLSDRGHNVSSAISIDETIKLLNEGDRTDLLVLDTHNADAERAVMDKVADLPPARQPKRIAVFSETVDHAIKDLRAQVSPAKAHLLLKPLHLHGLLSVLKTLETSVTR